MTERPEPSNSVWTLSGKTKAKENPLAARVRELERELVWLQAWRYEVMPYLQVARKGAWQVGAMFDVIALDNLMKASFNK